MRFHVEPSFGSLLASPTRTRLGSILQAHFLLLAPSVGGLYKQRRVRGSELVISILILLCIFFVGLANRKTGTNTEKTPQKEITIHPEIVEWHLMLNLILDLYCNRCCLHHLGVSFIWYYSTSNAIPRYYLRMDCCGVFSVFVPVRSRAWFKIC